MKGRWKQANYVLPFNARLLLYEYSFLISKSQHESSLWLTWFCVKQ